ncbi:hypothetical protein FA13DRAFT_1786363 [Coprinellus micaceus]|uniref:Uncharacterized protein n=1 Tax=Coprinellus micaceus TaxID=71717 RepID=A0A4Y7TTG7_COPMI|nr:hypothetical protein FA13DRAFT_1786363 [Coprinellus micaceus]
MASNQELLGAEHDANDEHTVAAGGDNVPHRSIRKCDGNIMSYLLEEEKRDEHDKIKSRFGATTTTRPAATKRHKPQVSKKAATTGGEEGDETDNDNFLDVDGTESEDEELFEEEINNDESAPAPKRARPVVTVEDVEDGDGIASVANADT